MVSLVLRLTVSRSVGVLFCRCLWTVRGKACPVLGSEWDMHFALPPLAFRAPRPIQESMREDLNAALDIDLSYTPPVEFQVAAGSTYVGGKMLAKMGRIALIAEELGRTAEAHDMAQRLALLLSTWIDSKKAKAPLLYDTAWGGVVSCGCWYDPKHKTCANSVGPACPGLTDFGVNFGHGFYQDHHFHFGKWPHASVLPFPASDVSMFGPSYLSLSRRLPRVRGCGGRTLPPRRGPTPVPEGPAHDPRFREPQRW